jgi:hypothetical protein
MQPLDPFPSRPTRPIRAGTFARLLQDIPELALHAGDLGVVRAVQPGLQGAFEVEFHRLRYNTPLRTLLLDRQIEAVNGPLITERVVARYQAC